MHDVVNDNVKDKVPAKLALITIAPSLGDTEELPHERSFLQMNCPEHIKQLLIPWA
jgi:hypothetical protein